MPTSRQLRRNESTSRSPIYAHFSETISGAMCIRAFGACERFAEESARRVDDNHTYYFAFTAASRSGSNITISITATLTDVDIRASGSNGYALSV